MESHIIGHPRVGTKFPLESFRDQKSTDRTSSAKESLKAATDLGSSVLKTMAYINSGIPTTTFVGAVPPAMEMTNYHLIALDVGPDGKSIYHKAVAEYKGPKAIHIHMCGYDYNNTVLSIMAAVEDKISINEKVLPVYREGVKNDAGIGPAGISPKIPYATPTSTTSSTHLHIHSRYSNSNGIIDSTIDANVITIEKSRPDEKLLQSAFLEGVKYGVGIGPGVYDIRSPCATPTSTTSSALLHIHMCYANSKLDDIIDSINDMDVDVIIIDSSRNIHSQPVPSTEEIADHINKKLAKLETKILWVNPGYGLKTRKNTMAKPSLENMVAATKLLRT